MPPKRVLGEVKPPKILVNRVDAADTDIVAPVVQHVEPAQEVECPICDKNLKNLRALNRHLDQEHSLDSSSNELSDWFSRGIANFRAISPISSVSPAPSSAASQQPVTVEDISKTHWKPHTGNDKCSVCSVKVGKKAVNCRHCGELVCSTHSKYRMKLNKRAEHDPTGTWFRCCETCFQSRPGYNDIAYSCDLSNTFKQIRRQKNEDQELRVDQLERRVARFTNRLLAIEKQNLYSFQARKLEIEAEESLVTWHDSARVQQCSICLESFGLFNRKHHCRLCGKVVCGHNCSHEVPLQILRDKLCDLELPQLSHNYMFRMCLTCRDDLLVKRQFTKDKESPLGEILQLQAKLSNMGQIINSLLTKAIGKDDAATRKRLVEAFTSYERLVKQVVNIKPVNQAEEKLQSSIQQASAMYIQSQMPAFKSATRIVVDTKPAEEAPQLIYNNLTIREVKDKRQELMVLQEQKFLVQEMIEQSKKQRNFDETVALESNIGELDSQIDQITRLLGENAF